MGGRCRVQDDIRHALCTHKVDHVHARAQFESFKVTTVARAVCEWCGVVCVRICMCDVGVYQHVFIRLASNSKTAIIRQCVSRLYTAWSINDTQSQSRQSE